MNLVIMSFTFFTVNLRKGSDLNSDLRAPGSFKPKQKQILKLFMFPILIVPVPSVGANKYGARPLRLENSMHLCPLVGFWIQWETPYWISIWSRLLKSLSLIFRTEWLTIIVKQTRHLIRNLQNQSNYLDSMACLYISAHSCGNEGNSTSKKRRREGSTCQHSKLGCSKWYFLCISVNETEINPDDNIENPFPVIQQHSVAGHLIFHFDFYEIGSFLVTCPLRHLRTDDQDTETV